MLLNKKFLTMSCLIISVILISCKTEIEPPPHKLFEEDRLVLKTAKEVMNQEVAFQSSGHFDSDTLKSIVAGVEIAAKNQNGVQFHLINWIDGSFEKTYSTAILEGSFSQCTVDKIKFGEFNYELIYFNSEAYFMGSSGGEVFSYIIDMKDKQIFSAHLTVASKGLVVLELSENIKNKTMKNFFVGFFRREYPSLSVLQAEN